MSNYKAKEEKRQCLLCGAEISGRRKKYCSDECRFESDRIQKRKKYRLENNITTKKCPVCNKEFEPNKNGARYKYCSTDCHKEHRKKQNRERMRKENGWSDKYDYDEIKKCKGCDADISHMKINAMYCSTLCRQRVEDRKRGHKPLEEHLKIVGERKKQRLEIEAKERQKEIEARKIARTVTKSCEWCGDEFTTDIPHKLTCSDTCRRKRSAKKHDKRINSNNIVDNDISLPRLYKRDQGICYLCHSKTDPTDIVRYPAYVIAGPRYPSIDHVIPIAKGGLHAWDNVKLACKQCNSSKSDTVDERELEEYLDKNKVTKRVKPKTKGKKVSQYTKDGRLIATYDSTVEAEKNTNLKRKGIQNCARGERKSHGGFVWRYV